MAKRPVWTFAVSAQQAERQFVGFCDMLRYDAAIVREHDRKLIILQTDRAPTDARWRSFGLPVLASARSQYTESAPIIWVRRVAESAIKGGPRAV